MMTEKQKELLKHIESLIHLLVPVMDGTIEEMPMIEIYLYGETNDSDVRGQYIKIEINAHVKPDR